VHLTIPKPLHKLYFQGSHRHYNIEQPFSNNQACYAYLVSMQIRSRRAYRMLISPWLNTVLGMSMMCSQPTAPTIGIPNFQPVSSSQTGHSDPVTCQGSSDFCRSVRDQMLFQLSQSGSCFQVLQRDPTMGAVLQSERVAKSLQTQQESSALQPFLASDYLLSGIVNHEGQRVHMVLHLSDQEGRLTPLYANQFPIWELSEQLRYLATKVQRHFMAQPDPPTLLPSIDQAWVQAQTFYTQRHYQDARRLLEYMVGVQPEALSAWLLLGKTQLHQRDYLAAIQSFSQLLEREPYHREAHLQRAVAYHQSQEHLLALVDLDWLLRQPQPQALWYSYRAQVHAALGQCAQRDADMHQACHLDSNECQRTISCP
jgi:hypothetical protein